MDAMSPRSIDVCSVGEVLVDFIAPDADDLRSAGTFLPAPGGAPANVAVGASRLGARTAFVGAVGEDAFGSLLEDALRANSVETSGLRRVPERTTLAFVTRRAGGIPDFLFYRGADMQLGPEDLPEELIARSRCVHLSSMALLTTQTRESTFKAIDLARRHGATVCVDPNLRPSSWPSLEEARAALAPLLDAAIILKVNDAEALLLTGAETLPDAMDELARDGRLLVVTAGAEGCFWRWSGEDGRVEAPRVDVIDTTGAGDAFVAALLASLAERTAGRSLMDAAGVEDIREALRFAAAAGALACTRPGAMSSLPVRDEVERLLSADGGRG